MTLDEVIALSDLLKGLYGKERFPGLTPAMADLWQEDLVHLTEELVRAGVRRWVRQHSDRPPSLDQICEQVEIVRDEQDRSRLPTRSKTVAEILHDAAKAQAANPLRDPDDVTYGHLMAELGIRSCDTWQDAQGLWHDKLTLEARGAQCYAWAEEHTTTRPKLAEDLRYTARKFAEILYAEQARAQVEAPSPA